MADLKAIAENLIKGNAAETKRLTQEAINDGLDPGQILNEGLIAGMDVVGQKFKNNEFYVPEVLIAARAMHSAMEVLRPLLTATGVKTIGSVAIGTVKGDLHDIGKNLVAMMLEGGGFKVIDLGIDVGPEKFIDVTRKQKVDIVAMSALLTTTMPGMKTVIESLKNAGIREKVKVMIGGAPVTQQYADEIGADGYAPDAASAVDKAKELLKVTA